MPRSVPGLNSSSGPRSFLVWSHSGLGLWHRKRSSCRFARNKKNTKNRPSTKNLQFGLNSQGSLPLFDSKPLKPSGFSAYTDAGDVTGDLVLEQVENTYNSASQVILVTSKRHFHDDTGTGELGTATTGNKARVSYAASYFDGADRITAMVNVGTNGGSAYTRPSTVPSRSDTALVTSYAYAAGGWLQDTTDPKGLVTRATTDNLGRVTKTVENYTNGTVTDTSNKTTEFTYNAVGRTTVKVVLPSSG